MKSLFSEENLHAVVTLIKHIQEKEWCIFQVKK